MPQNADKGFYERANTYINLANDQLQHDIQGKVSASFSYASARFSASLTASGYKTRDEMLAHRDENVEYFLREYRLMLEEHMDDYIKNFDSYMKLARQSN